MDLSRCRGGRAFDEAGFLAACGLAVRDARKGCGFSREELSDLSGIDAATIGAVERGERSVSVVPYTRLLLALGCSHVSLHGEGVGLTIEGPGELAAGLMDLPAAGIVGNIGEAIRHCRRARGLSLEETGRLAGLHRNTVWNIERGLSPASSMTLYRVYLALGVADLGTESGKLRLD